MWTEFMSQVRKFRGGSLKGQKWVNNAALRSTLLLGAEEAIIACSEHEVNECHLIFSDKSGFFFSVLADRTCNSRSQSERMSLLPILTFRELLLVTRDGHEWGLCFWTSSRKVLKSMEVIRASSRLLEWQIGFMYGEQAHRLCALLLKLNYRALFAPLRIVRQWVSCLVCCIDSSPQLGLSCGCSSEQRGLQLTSCVLVKSKVSVKLCSVLLQDGALTITFVSNCSVVFKALCYKLEDHGFDTRLVELIFSIYLILK
jgi:hypothetical protein